MLPPRGFDDDSGPHLKKRVLRETGSGSLRSLAVCPTTELRLGAVNDLHALSIHVFDRCTAVLMPRRQRPVWPGVYIGDMGNTFGSNGVINRFEPTSLVIEET